MGFWSCHSPRKYLANVAEPYPVPSLAECIRGILLIHMQAAESIRETMCSLVGIG